MYHMHDTECTLRIHIVNALLCAHVRTYMLKHKCTVHITLYLSSLYGKL